MFERMDIAESIYEGAVEPSYKKPTWVDSISSGHIRNKSGESASSKYHPTTVERSEKCRKQYVDSSKSKSKTCLIYDPRHSYYECKVLGDFGTKYANHKPNKDLRNHPIPRKYF